MKPRLAGPVLAALALAAAHFPAHALLVNYEFEGIVTTGPAADVPGISAGTSMTGRLSFNTDNASPTGSGIPGNFDINPLNVRMDIGPYTIRHIHSGGVGAFFKTDSIGFQNLPVAPGTDPGLNVINTHLSVKGDFFDAVPTNADDLENGRWAQTDISQRQSAWAVDIAADGSIDQFNGIFTRFAFVPGGNVAPVPEPATMILFGSALAGIGGSRLRKRRQNRLSGRR